MSDPTAPAAPQRWSATLRRHPIAVAAAVVVALVAVAGVVVLSRQAPAVVVTASAETEGQLQSLATSVDSASGQSRAQRTAAWTTPGDGVGQWVSLRYDEAVPVDAVRLLSAAGGGTLRSALLVFDSGASLLVTADADGDVDATFPRRTAREVRIAVADVTPGDGGTTAVSLAAADLSAGSGGPAAAEELGAPQITASSGGDTTALDDGDVAAGQAGAQWSADQGDAEPWVEYSWPSPVVLSSAQVLGPEESAFAADYAAAAALNGRLEFDDGSSVVVSGVEGGGGEGTTVAFAPRVVSSVRLVLAKTIPQATLALRELRFYAPGTTPPRWPAAPSELASQPAPAQACSDPSQDPYRTTAATSDSTPLALLCPSVGSAAGASATVAVKADPGTQVQASGALVVDGAPTAPRPLASGTADASGRAVVQLDLSTLQSGPLTLEVTRVDAGDELPLSVQLVNSAGTALAQPADGGSTAPAGMTLQWDEEFTAPLAATETGAGSTYAASKPEYWGSSQFGDAVFVDPALDPEALSVVDEQYLRIRAHPVGDLPVDRPYGQEHVSGIISSARQGAGGFSAQYGYFEARMMGGPGTGTWPAFWTLNTQAATRDSTTSGEGDTVELYGHEPELTCHTVHAWGSPQARQSTSPHCLDTDTASWPSTWHTYGMRIVPGGAVFYVDGREVTSEQGLGRSEEPFYFLLNLALGGGWPVDLSATSGTSDLYVDWVRVYS